MNDAKWPSSIIGIDKYQELNNPYVPYVPEAAELGTQLKLQKITKVYCLMYEADSMTIPKIIGNHYFWTIPSAQTTVMMMMMMMMMTYVNCIQTDARIQISNSTRIQDDMKIM